MPDSTKAAPTGSLAIRTAAGHGMVMTVSRGPNAGTRYRLNADLTQVGRCPDADIRLDDITVTRRHAQFRRTATGVQVTDLGSHNGTYVNQERVHSAPVRPGDEIQVGRFRLTISLDDQTIGDLTPASAMVSRPEGGPQ